MQLYLALLRSFLDGKTYRRYYSYLNQDFLDKNYPEIGRVFKTLPTLHEGSDEDRVHSTVDLSLSFFRDFPKADHSFYDRLFADIDAVDAHPDQVIGYLEEARRRQIALDAAKASLRLAEGIGSVDEVLKLTSQFTDDRIVHRFKDKFVNQSLQELYDENVKNPGLRWRLNSLNSALGSLRKGDFGFVFARPETGKTTFLASEATHMASQGSGPVLWFNNEEQGGKVKSRCFQAVLGLTRDALYADIQANEEEFNKLVGDKLQIYNEATITKLDVEAICEEYKPKLVIFDQIDKIKGFAADRNDLELKELYAWAREIAKEYGPTIGVCQAGASGEDKMWLTMNDVDSSKTSKQGEADWILGIGKVHQPDKQYVRYMHLSKNKLQGDTDSDGSMRHGRWSCFIKPEIARYMDFNDDGSV